MTKSIQIRHGEITDNHGNRVNVILGLKKGDKLIARKSIKSVGDIGTSSMTYQYDSFIPGKVYTVNHLFNWDFKFVAYVLDEEGLAHLATTELFDIQ